MCPCATYVAYMTAKVPALEASDGSVSYSARYASAVLSTIRLRTAKLEHMHRLPAKQLLNVAATSSSISTTSMSMATLELAAGA